MRFRSPFTLLLLLHYLLVVGLGLVERPAKQVERAFAYVHSPDCQLRHTLRVACFDDCNGIQYKVQKHSERLPLHQLLSTLKGVDAHCLPATWAGINALAFGQPEGRLVPCTVAIPGGYRGQIDLPPRRG